ncbi:ead/Ea22-like family protein [Pseudomonas sp. CMR5c]|uniref:ead/Ea22-like family protein n=1 Tax=Pseudomonas sp. CMR5c TaxID=658630 RepID=UPI000A964129|nr:ead/Ea22-like family protein [Pseudomonas sp. CMR5c]AZC19586.1 hypothetical protein C4K40_4205 [Pseudomonas sp. CMR5c]
MNIDKERLKALAEAAQAWSGEIGEQRWYEADCFKQPYFSLPDAEFLGSVSPAAVLALLAEIEALHESANFRAVQSLRSDCEALRKDAERSRRMLLDACVSIGSIGEALGLDMDADADMMIGTARDLIDGLNRIIKECPLGSPGFAIATEVLGELGVQQEVQP